jgi:hypothetical protein
MAEQLGFFDCEDRLKALSAAGDPLDRLAQVYPSGEHRRQGYLAGLPGGGARPAAR